MANVLAWVEPYSRWRDASSPKIKSKALADIIRSFEPLINRVISWYPGLDEMTQDDLRQAGRMGIMRAVEKFDPVKREALTPYALLWVRQSVYRELVKLHRPGQVSVSNEVFETYRREMSQFDTDPTPLEYVLEVEDRMRIWKYVYEAGQLLDAPSRPKRQRFLQMLRDEGEID